MSKANDIQHGGNHYKRAGAIQHWDLCGKYKVGYFESAASKYVSRHDQKNGLQDLQKASHYIEKRLELAKQFPETHSGPEGSVPIGEVLDWCDSLELNTPEDIICIALLSWGQLFDLEIALVVLEDLKLERYPEHAKTLSPE